MFYEKLTALCESRGTTVPIVLEQLEMGKGNIYKWKKGVIPSNTTIKKLTEFLKVDGDYFRTNNLMLGNVDHKNKIPVGGVNAIKILGSVKAGFGLDAEENMIGYDFACANPACCFYLKINGNSMAPEILNGQLALVDSSKEVKSGDVALVIWEGEGMIKQVFFSRGKITLRSFNDKYSDIIISGAELDNVIIQGKVIETKKKW